MRSLAVQRKYIDAWVDQNYPNAITKLSSATGIPANSLTKIRLGWAPKNGETRKRLAHTIGVPEDLLFPKLKRERGVAAS